MTDRPPAPRPAPVRAPALVLPQRFRPLTDAVRTPRGGCLAACAAGALGLVAGLVPVAGPALAAALVGAFVLLGPGLALLPHVGGVRPDGAPTDGPDVAGLPRSAAAVLVPVAGVSVVVLATTAAADAGWWHPHVLLAALVTATAAATRAPVRQRRSVPGEVAA